MLRKLRFVFPMLAILAMVLAACQPKPPAVEPTQVAEADVIRIGGFGPLSAPGAYRSGIEMQQAAKMAVDEINLNGGVLGKNVELIFGDTEGLPERGTAVTERLITQNKVVGLIGEYHSGVALTEMEVAHKYGIPVVFSEPWSDDVTGSGYPEIFRISPSIDYYSSIASKYYAATGWKKFVFIQEDTDYGHSSAESITKQLAGYGITDVETIFADPATEDFTPTLQRIMQNPPDVLVSGVTGMGTYRMVRQACDLGLAPTAKTALYAADAQLPEYWENVGDCGQYALFTYVGLPPSLYNDKTRAFLDNFEKLYEVRPGAHAMEAYDSVYLMVEAIRAAGSTEPAAIIAALESIQYDGVLGKIWFEYGSKNPISGDVPKWMWHQFPTPSVYIMQYTEINQPFEESVVVFPREVSTGPLYTGPK
ncbi:MAG: ABC transporter substrate-binding protein [Chloroflexi bacterium]|nr:ABC transporter substrate-binding protein [Chloroflexota bacterium]